MDTKIAIFKGKEVRKTLHKNEWWFVINDVISVLTDSADPSGYLKDMRRRDAELLKGWGQVATPLSIATPAEYKKLKKLKQQNLRDHINDLELIFSMLGEASTTEITRSQDVQG